MRRVLPALLGCAVLVAGCAAPAAAPSGAAPSPTASTASASMPAVTSPSPVTPAPTVSGSGTPGTPSSPAASATPGQTLTVALGGDMLWHMSLLSSVKRDTASGKGYDTTALVAQASGMLKRSDLAVCNQEVPILKPGEEPSGFPEFGAPADMAKAAASMGFNACTTASNHSYDRGTAGIDSTIEGLHAVGIATCGTARTQAEGEAPCLVTARNGVRVGLVTGAYSLNSGAVLPPWQYNVLHPDVMVAQAKAAREAGAQVVLCSVHAGDEYKTPPNADQRWAATALAESGQCDLVYGHHTHVVQPWTTINGTWVAYGLGNFVGQMNPDDPGADEGIIGEFTFTAQPSGRFKVTRAAYAPMLMTLATDDQPARLLHVTDAAAQKYASASRLKLARTRIADAVGSMGVSGIVVD